MHSIKLNGEFVDFGDQVAFNMVVETPQVREFALALALLVLGLSPKLMLGELNGIAVLVEVDESLPEHSRGRVAVGLKSADFRLTRAEAEAWLYFVLRAYRDGKAEASHFELDLEGDRVENGKPVVITFTFEAAKAPIGREELLRKLGLES